MYQFQLTQPRKTPPRVEYSAFAKIRSHVVHILGEDVHTYTHTPNSVQEQTQGVHVRARTRADINGVADSAQHTTVQSRRRMPVARVLKTLYGPRV